jgi:hypothetical protein
MGCTTPLGMGHCPTYAMACPAQHSAHITTYTGAVFGVHKCGLDVSLKAAHNEHLRAEAIEWAGHWYKEHGLAPHPWDVRLCVELAVGQLKGYLLN